MRDYKKSIRSLVHVLNALEKSGGLTARERLLIGRLLKKLMRAIEMTDKKSLRKTIDEICKIFANKVRR